MSLYSSGGIDAHNAYAQNIHNINQSVHSFNHGIADQLDQLREAQDQEGSIEAGINMLKGSTALNSARGGYKAYIEGLQRGGASELGGKGGVVSKVFGKVQKSRLATRFGEQPKRFAPVDTTGIAVDATYGEKLAETTPSALKTASDFERGVARGEPIEMFGLSAVDNPYRVARRAGTQPSGYGGFAGRSAELGQDVREATQSGIAEGTASEWRGFLDDLSDDTPPSSERGSFAKFEPEPEPEPDFRLNIDEDYQDSLARGDYEEAMRQGTINPEDVPAQFRRGGGVVKGSVGAESVGGSRASAYYAQQGVGDTFGGVVEREGEVPFRGGEAPTWSAEGKIAEAAEAGVEVGEDAAKVGAKIGGSAVPIISEIGWDRGIRGAGGFVSGGLDIYKDIQRVREGKNALGDNWASSIGNVANIVGSGLEVAGAFGIATPVFELVGAGLAIGGSALEAVGESDSKDESDAAAQADVAGQRLAQTTASATTTVSGRSY